MSSHVVPWYWTLTFTSEYEFRDQRGVSRGGIFENIYSMAMKTNSVFFKERFPTPSKRQWTTPTSPNVRHLSASTPSKVRTTPGDRYVPSRIARDLEFTRFQMNTPFRNNLPHTPCHEENTVMRERLLALKGQSSDKRVLAFRQEVTPSCGKCEF